MGLLLFPWEGKSKSRPLGQLTDAGPDATDWHQLIEQLYATQACLLAACDKITLLMQLLTRPVHILAFSQTVRVLHIKSVQVTQSLSLKQSVKLPPRATQKLEMHQTVTVTKVPAKQVIQKLEIHQSAVAVKKGK